MNNLVEIIKNAFEEEKRTADYKLQLNKVCEMEDAFVKEFSKEKWKEYFLLDIEKGQLQLIEIDQLIKFVIKFLKQLN